MNDRVEIVRSNKGGAKIIHRGYMYTVHKKRNSGIRWRCTQRSLHCKGSISTGSGPPRVNMPHNHVPDPHAVAVAKCRASEYEEIPADVDIKPLLPILNFKSADSHATKLSRARSTPMVEMERLLIVCIRKRMDDKKSAQPSCAFLQDLAVTLYADLRKLYPELPAENFTTSKGWFERFKKRANL